jgi:hypothetical protein
MNQIRLYTWKCHKEIPCAVIWKKQKCHFFFLSIAKSENGRAKQALPVCVGGTDISEREKEVGKQNKRVNMVQILCTHECKQKKDACWNYFLNGRRGDTGGGVNSIMIYLNYLQIYFVNATTYPYPAHQ